MASRCGCNIKTTGKRQQSWPSSALPNTAKLQLVGNLWHRNHGRPFLVTSHRAFICFQRGHVPNSPGIASGLGGTLCNSSSVGAVLVCCAVATAIVMPPQRPQSYAAKGTFEAGLQVWRGFQGGFIFWPCEKLVVFNYVRVHPNTLP